MRQLPALVLAATLALAPIPAQAWETYENPTYGYAIDLPGAPFAVEERADGQGVSLIDIAGRGQIDVYGAQNTQNLSPREFEAALGEAERIREVTYARRGNSWFVLSGYYHREGDERDDLIFYAKFMFSPDRSRLAGFEASYPQSDRARWDPIIETIEDSFRAPK
jgi:hypothetical protein